MFNLNDIDWALAKRFFTENPLQKKFIPTPSKSRHYFIKTDEGDIFALPRKGERNANAQHYILGKGAYSLVIKAQNERGQIIACKLFDPDYILTEDYSLRVMQHLNILMGQMTRSKKTEKNIIDKHNHLKIVKKKAYRLEPLVAGETFFHIIDAIYNKKKEQLPTIYKDMIALKACLALLAYHQRGIIHGDINFSNLMIYIDEEADDITVTLIDQGFAILLNPGETAKKLTFYRGTKKFSAPEILNEKYFSFRSDIYALGRIFKYLNREAWSKKLMAAEPTDRPSLQEMMLLILIKIKKDSLPLSPAFKEVIGKTQSFLHEYYSQKLKEGVFLDFLLNALLIKTFFNESEKIILILQLAKAIFLARKLKEDIKIFSEHDFFIKKEMTGITVSFQECLSVQNPELFAPELKDGFYFEQSLVYSLAKIAQTVECDYPEEALSIFPQLRGDLRTFVTEVIEYAEQMVEPPYRLTLIELRTFFQIPLLKPVREDPSVWSFPQEGDNANISDNEDDSDNNLNLGAFFQQFEEQLQLFASAKALPLQETWQPLLFSEPQQSAPISLQRKSVNISTRLNT